MADGWPTPEDPVCVSVVIPTFNRRDILERCLKSVQKSDYPRLELIVVDDFSNDGTGRLMEGVPRLTYVRNEEELLLAACRNKGAKVASGHYLFFLDDDNVVASDTISMLVRAFSDNPSAGVIGPIMYYLSDPHRIWCAGVLRHFRTGIACFITETNPSSAPFLIECSDLPNALMMRRSAFDSVGGFDSQSYPIHLDEADLCERVRKSGCKVFVSRDAKVWHDVPPLRTTGPLSLALERYSPTRAFHAARSRVVWWRKHNSGFIFCAITALALAFIFTAGIPVAIAAIRSGRIHLLGSWLSGLYQGFLAAS